MPRSRRPGGASGRCTHCGGDLMRIVVLHGGRREHCLTCGFAQMITSAPPDLPTQESGTEPADLQDTVHLLLYAQAVLQTVRQARGCSRCRERLTLLQAQIDDLEQTHVDYSLHPEQCDDARLDAFFDELTARLQGLGQICRACRRRMEGTTWELFVGLLLAARDDGES